MLIVIATTKGVWFSFDRMIWTGYEAKFLGC